MSTPETGNTHEDGTQRVPLIVLAWLWVVVPLGYGLYELILKLRQLFTG